MRTSEEDKPLLQQSGDGAPTLPSDAPLHEIPKEDMANLDAHYGVYVDANALKAHTASDGLLDGAEQVFVPTAVWLTGASQYWLQGQTGQGTVVGVIDSGIDDSHPALKGKLLGRRDYVAMRNANGDRSKVEDPSTFNPHGTHVAGTIAAAPSKDNLLAGVAPGAQLYDYRVLGTDGRGFTDDIVNAIRDAVDDGCHVINMSLGSGFPSNAQQAALKYARDRNVALIAAAGNEQTARSLKDALSDPEISYPAYFPETLAVAACEFNDETGEVTPAAQNGVFFSNTNMRVDVAADGQDVISCVPGGGYAEYDGTSMASPCVAGMAALLRSRVARRSGEDVAAAVDLHALLKSEAVDTALVGPDTGSGKNQLFGFGICTLWAELPLRSGGEWRMPSLGLFRSQ
eukprot:PRCOL_00004858-RA